MITGLHHYALAVPGLDVADKFLRGFGLGPAAPTGVPRHQGAVGMSTPATERDAVTAHHVQILWDRKP